MNRNKKHNVLFLILLVFIIPVMTQAQSDKKLVRQGNKDFQNGDFNEAEINYRKALDKNPTKQSAQFNLGDALYEQENYEKAGEVFASSNIEKSSDFEKSSTSYNLGNSFLKGDKLDESISAYKQALKFNPRNEDARYNLEYARQKQAQQKQEQDQNKDDKQDKDKQDQNKDQQDQNQDQQDQNKDQQEKNQDEQQDQQNQQNQDQQQQNQQGQQNEQQAQKISKKDAERMLEALKNNEKKTLEKLKKEKKKNAKVIKSEKDW